MTDEQIMQIAHPHDHGGAREWCFTGPMLLAFARALLAAGASEGQAEPVAVANIYPDNTCGLSWIAPAYSMLPAGEHRLYTHPSAEIAALRERIAGMEKDAERLDWLASNEHMRLKRSSDEYVVWNCSEGLEIAGEGATPREAIDAAIAKESCND